MVRNAVWVTIVDYWSGRFLFGGDWFCRCGEQSGKPFGKRTVRAPDGQSGHSGSQDGEYHQESAYCSPHSEPPARRSISAYFACNSTFSFSRSSWTARSLRSDSKTKEISEEPAWKAVRALSTDERAGGSWRDA